MTTPHGHTPPSVHPHHRKGNLNAMTDLPAPTLIGADLHIRNALEMIASDVERYPGSIIVQVALSYLRHVLPYGSPEKAALVVLDDLVQTYREANDLGSGIGYDPVANAVEALRGILAVSTQTAPLRVRSPAQLRALCRSLGLSPDVHKPEWQKVSVAFTEGTFDNSGHVVLERQVVMCRGGVPVAQINVANLLAWAATAPEPPA
jgi:hypothetical protein